MHKLFTRLALAASLVVALALPAFAGELDDYYLSAFGAKPGTALEKAILSSTAVTGETRRCGTPLKHGLSRDWNKLEPATQKTLAAAQVNIPPTLPKVLTSSGGHFSIHYTDAVGDADTPDIAKLGLTSVADWVGQVGDAFEYAFSYYNGLGYHMPPMNNTNTYDIYLVNLAGKGEYGETDDIQRVATSGFPYASSSYIEVDKDFTNGVFHPETYSPLQSLQVTSAHEFHHAIQYGYNYYFDIWYAEVTSTWMEDEVHDSVNQLYDYLPKYLSFTGTISLNAGPDGESEYGRWIFNRYLAEKHSSAVVKSIWEALPTKAPVNGSDIPMAPVIDSVLSGSYGSSLAAEFFGLAKIIYTRDWRTAHPSDVSMIPKFSAVASYSSYPVTAADALTPTITLPHYSFAFYKFVPASGLPQLTISLAQTNGIKTAVFEKIGGSISEIAANTGGTSYTISDFGTLNAASDEVVLLVANTGSTDNQTLNFSTDGTPKAVASPSKSKGGGGCFIATAAYGSYMHPKVAELREFRDRYLLTNAPGRLFVALYYRLSPPIASVIAEHAWMRAGVRVGLTPVVLAVENPVGALLVLLLSGGGVVWRLARRYRFAQLAKGSC